MVKKLIYIISILVMFVSLACAANVDLAWNSVQDADGYKLYMSQDSGLTWDTGVDVGDVTIYTYQNVPDVGLVLFRVGAYNENGETLRSWSGAWWNSEWQPPTPAGGLGVQ